MSDISGKKELKNSLKNNRHKQYKDMELTTELKKRIAKNNYYSEENFIKDAQTYIEAIKQNRVIVSVANVSKSGMSRKLKVLAYEPNKETNAGYYRQFLSMFEALGYKVKDYSFTVNGCGMDMIFHTNYSAMHTFKNIGLITKEECEILAQKTPQTI